MTAINPLMAISPLDGRYHLSCDELRQLVSEYGLIYYRLLVEIKWLQALSILGLKDIPSDLHKNFTLVDAQKIKELEKTTNHDVKALEYFIKEKLSAADLAHIQEFVHFACTSEDINNLAYALMLKDVRQQVLLPQLNALMEHLSGMVKDYANIPMLSRTHGQAASPTTVGKEITNVLARLKRQLTQFEKGALLGKMNGAVGNFNAHTIAYPEINWPEVSQKFVESLGLQYNPLTTQIEPHDYIAEYFHCLMRINTILIDFTRDMWGYISLGYFDQKLVAGEIGSSTMPHKVNPIDFENAEGNFGLANALLGHLAEKLPISRFQRDLTDSTVLRNVGVACGYTLLALKSLQKGLNKVVVNQERLAADLNANWEVLAEALQTVMRRYNIPKPYEQLKELTRGKTISSESLREFIDKLALPDDVKKKLKELTPAKYIGMAEELSRAAL